jgi:hypothetical protein
MARAIQQNARSGSAGTVSQPTQEWPQIRRECARGDDADVGFEHRAVWYGANDAIAR